MRMDHIYQPVMLIELLKNKGTGFIDLSSNMANEKAVKV